MFLRDVINNCRCSWNHPEYHGLYVNLGYDTRSEREAKWQTLESAIEMSMSTVDSVPIKAKLILAMLVFTLASIWQAHAEETPATLLSVKVKGLSHASGDVRISIYSSQTDWLENSTYDAVIPVNGDSVVWNITGLTPGQYAIASFHDINSNGECDSNFFGFPTEAFGFSNNIRPKLSAPKWAQTKFTFADSTQELEITLK